MSTALLPGSYDPITNGHLDIIKRASTLYDKVIVLSAINPNKKYLLSADDRLVLIEDAVRDLPNVTADSFPGYLVDYCAIHENPVIVKGLRNEKDFLYEQEMALANKELGLKRHGINVETVFICANEKFSDTSSTSVRAHIEAGTNFDDIVPNPELLKKILK